MACDLPLVYNDDRWATIVSPDQVGCNQWLGRNKYPTHNGKLLHVGVGNSSTYKAFGDRFVHVDGITIMQSEIKAAITVMNAHETPYLIHQVNKYDVEQLRRVGNQYDVIVDNNLKQHACCNQHWREYIHELGRMLNPDGIILTHTQGFSPHTTRVEPLTIDELVEVSRHITKIKLDIGLRNEWGHYPVVLQA